MVTGVVRGLSQLLDCDIWRREIWVTESEIDDVLAGAACLDLHWNEKFPSATGFSSIEGPPFFNEPAFNDRMPAGAGFIQTQGPEGFGEPAFNERMPSASGFI
jgi:hypothetical protein